MRKKSFVR